MIYIALPEDGFGHLVPCDADGEPTEFRIPPWVRKVLRAAEKDGLIPGSYIALWTEDEVRVADYDDGGDTDWPLDLNALWADADVLP